MDRNKQIEGILIPMPTSFKEDGAIDEAGTDALADFYVNAGVQGFFALGTHGQGMVMEIDERKRVAERLVRRVAGKVPIVLHIGTGGRLVHPSFRNNGRAVPPDFMADLAPPREVQMGAREAQPEFSVLAPAATALIEDRPTFSWQSLPGAAGYVVTVFDEHGAEAQRSTSRIRQTTGTLRERKSPAGPARFFSCRRLPSARIDRAKSRQAIGAA